MQAIIMAAGRGSRLGDLTADRPKALLEVRGHSLMDYNLALLNSRGITDIKLVTGYRHDRYDVPKLESRGITCIYNPFYEVCNNIGSFYLAQPYLDDTDTTYINADTLCDPEIFDEMTAAAGDIVLPVDFRPTDEEAMKVAMIDGRVTRVNKAVSLSEAAGEFIGIAKITAGAMPAVKAACRKLIRAGKVNTYFESILEEVISQGTQDVRTVATSRRFWGEVDFAEDYARVKENLPQTLFDLAEGRAKSRA